MELELLCIQRAPQLRFERAPGDRRLAQVRRVELMAAAGIGPGALKREITVGEDLLGVVAMVGECCDADAGAQVHRFPVDREGHPQRAKQAICQFGRLSLVG